MVNLITKPYWINVGCGTDFKAGMLNVDILPAPENLPVNIFYVQGSAIHLFDTAGRGPDGDGWHGIEAIYMMEHVPVGELHTMLYNWNLCLCMGGLVRIVVPCLDAAIAQYTKDDSYAMFRTLIYEMMGGPEETGVSPHTALWNLKWASLFLQSEGFEVVRHQSGAGSRKMGLLVEAKKVVPSTATEERDLWNW